MTVTAEQVLAQLKRVKGPDLESNIVDLGLVSEVVIRAGRASFAITVPASRAAELEPLREAAEKVVRDMPGIEGAIAVLTAENLRVKAGLSDTDISTTVNSLATLGLAEQTGLVNLLVAKLSPAGK